ncbi:hypothetical protein B0T17DRAFT_511705 [Bombardia bombarda]|uniref:Uncharacterized protein n=1 Tax=Bombardia bombarda TaxID=252184 RepID=A0AA39W4U4_9PEZI|nr:hypothetical protein B0T17DRAFT_511705 [Bombardia bombarda]
MASRSGPNNAENDGNRFHRSASEPYCTSVASPAPRHGNTTTSGFTPYHSNTYGGLYNRLALDPYTTSTGGESKWEDDMGLDPGSFRVFMNPETGSFALIRQATRTGGGSTVVQPKDVDGNTFDWHKALRTSNSIQNLSVARHCIISLAFDTTDDIGRQFRLYFTQVTEDAGPDIPIKTTPRFAFSLTKGTFPTNHRFLKIRDINTGKSTIIEMTMSLTTAPGEPLFVEFYLFPSFGIRFPTLDNPYYSRCGYYICCQAFLKEMPDVTDWSNESEEES